MPDLESITDAVHEHLHEAFASAAAIDSIIREGIAAAKGRAPQADIVAATHGPMMTFLPQTDKARHMFAEHIEGAAPFGEMYVLDAIEAPGLLEWLIDQGFTIAQ